MSIEEKRKEFAAALKSQFADQDIKALTNPEGIKQYVQTQEELLEAFGQKKRPSPDILGVLRSSCSICTKSCECYEPFEVFLLEMSEMVYSNTFVPTLCRNCKCPAHFHPAILKELRFPNEVKEGLRTTVLKEDHLNFSGIILVLDVDFQELDRLNITLKQQEDKLYELLKHGGFTVVCRSVKVLSSTEKVALGQKNTRMTTTGAFLNAIVKKTVFTVEAFQKQTMPVLREKQEEPLLLLCLSSIYVNSQVQFFKFITAAGKYLPSGITVLYASMNSVQGFTDCSIFFPEVFTVKKTCVVIPTESFTAVTLDIDPIMSFFKMQSMKLKGKNIENKDQNLLKVGKTIDLLNYNGYSPMKTSESKVENPSDLQMVFEKFMESTRAEYISKFILSNSDGFKIHTIGAGKVGIPLVISLAAQSMESFTFTAEKDTFHLFSYFLPDLVTSSRSLLVFRPICVRSGLDKVFLEIFKKNYFIVLQEEYRKLSVEEVKVLGGNLNFANFSEFIDLMTEGESRIVAVSKLGGLEEALILANGCEKGRRRTEKRLLQQRTFTIDHSVAQNPFKIKLDEEIGLDTYKKPMIKEQVQVSHNLEENSLFTISPFSSISEALDLDSIVDSRIKSMQHELDLPNFHIKQMEIDRLRYFSRYFNIVLHTSSDHTSSEGEILKFFPNLCLYSDVILSLRPECLSLENESLDLFKHMKVKIIKACTENGRNYYHISKLAGRDEFQSVFEYKCPVISILKPQNLSNIFELSSIPNEFEDSLDLISPNIKNLSLIDISLLPKDSIIDICNFILLVTSFEDLIPESIEYVYNYSEFIHYALKCTTRQGTCKELRIRKIKISDSEDPSIETLELFDEYSVISWYYKEISKYFPKIVPMFYDFKLDPVDKNMNVTRAFSCSEYKGPIFLKPIAEMMKENRQREILTRKTRGSVVAFMWGRKLALLVERIELVKADEVEDFGSIYWNGKGKFLGFHNGSYLDFDRKKFMMYFEQLKLGWENYASMSVMTSIEKKFKFIISCLAFEETRKSEHFSLVPEMVEFINLRVFAYKEKPDIGNIEFIDAKIAAFNDLYDRTAKDMDMWDMGLVDTFPAKYTKRHMAANIIWLINAYLKFFDNKASELNMEHEEYLIMLESLLNGFLNNYTQDKGIEGISVLYIEYFLFSLSRAFNLVMDILQVQNRRDTFPMGSFSISQELIKLDQEEQKLSQNLKTQLELLADIDINYHPKSGEKDDLKIDRSRYFKHYMIKEFETNLKHPKYPNTLIRAKFPIVAPQIEEFIKGGLSDVQKKWFNPLSPSKTNLRPVPKSAFRFDSILVKNTKWMTHQRQQKLVKEAILYLTKSVMGFKTK